MNEPWNVSLSYYNYATMVSYHKTSTHIIKLQMTRCNFVVYLRGHSGDIKVRGKSIKTRNGFMVRSKCPLEFRPRPHSTHSRLVCGMFYLYVGCNNWKQVFFGPYGGGGLGERKLVFIRH